MNYQHYLDGLATLQPDVQKYIKECVAYRHDQRTALVDSLYLEVLEEHMGWVESTHQLDLLDDGDWEAVYEHAEGERE